MVELSEKLSFPALEPLTGFTTASSGARRVFQPPRRALSNLAGSFMAGIDCVKKRLAQRKLLAGATLTSCSLAPQPA